MRRGLFIALAVVFVSGAGCISAPRRSDGCGANRDCPAGQVCVERACRQPCVSDGDCPADQHCAKGLCEPGAARPEVRSTIGIVPAGARLTGGRFTLDAQLGEAVVPARAVGGRWRLEGSATLNPGRR